MSARWLVTAAALIACSLAFDCAHAGETRGNRNALRTIIENCLDATVADYCARCPSPMPGTCGIAACWNTTEVWAETPQFVAIRDRKMCDCPTGFVHGLAIPRTVVTGVEDPRRPEGIWPFAWRVALERIPAAQEILLVVNPPFQRTQDELHVHIVRLIEDGRARIEARRPIRIDRPDEAWSAAATHAKRMRYATYGVAVTQAPGGGWLVVSTDVSPEYEFTQSTCGGRGVGPRWP